MTLCDSLRLEIEETHFRFHRLLDSIPDSAFTRSSGNKAWNIGEVLYHMSIAPRFLIEDVRMISGQRWIYRLIPLLMPKRFFDWLNAHLTRFGARNLSRGFLADQYDRAHARTLEILSQIREEDWQKCIEYPDWDSLLSGTVTMERLFHYVKVHFDSHEEEIRNALAMR